MKIDNENKRHDDGIVALLHAKAQFRRHSIPPINIDWEQLDTLACERFPLLTTSNRNKINTIGRELKNRFLEPTFNIFDGAKISKNLCVYM